MIFTENKVSFPEELLFRSSACIPEERRVFLSPTARLRWSPIFLHTTSACGISADRCKKLLPQKNVKSCFHSLCRTFLDSFSWLQYKNELSH